MPVRNYFIRFVDSETEYIAYKEFSNYGMKLVYLTKVADQYVLSASLAAVPHSTLAKNIDAETGVSLFTQVQVLKESDHYNGGDSLHTKCVITGIKTSNTNTHYTGLYNPPLLIDQYNQSENRGLRIYSLLTTLLNQQLPDYIDQIIAINKRQANVITVEGKDFLVDNSIDVTAEESEAFFQQLIKNPFFEISGKRE